MGTETHIYVCRLKLRYVTILAEDSETDNDVHYLVAHTVGTVVGLCIGQMDNASKYVAL